MVEQFEKLDQGDIDRTLAGLTAGAPAVKQAEAKLESANRDLFQAELNLRYCDVVAEIDGVVTRRNVNPGAGADFPFLTGSKSPALVPILRMTSFAY